MFAYSQWPLGGRDIRMTPSRLETPAGRLPRPPKSPMLATRSLRCSRTRCDREGRKVRRDVLTKGIPMYTPENEAARPELARAANETTEADNLEGNDTQTATKQLFAEADAVAVCVPYLVTRERKRATVVCLCGMWLKALAAAREEQAV